ncbi:DUF1624 domain-containing protein [Ectothiorhodospiraceae bacterium BW-2]|nr:DUF1624 domain-containing protein [Ectothiorhodospiraceae bacterium BW-2]
MLYHDLEHEVRYPLPDQLRGLAVALMVLFHLCYGLTLFGYMLHQPLLFGCSTNSIVDQTESGCQ